jgi:hypothetical protein
VKHSHDLKCKIFSWTTEDEWVCDFLLKLKEKGLAFVLKDYLIFL